MASSTYLRLRSNVAQYESSGGVQPESFASKVVATRSKLIVMFVFLDSTFKKYIFCDSENFAAVDARGPKESCYALHRRLCDLCLLLEGHFFASRALWLREPRLDTGGGSATNSNFREPNFANEIPSENELGANAALIARKPNGK